MLFNATSNVFATWRGSHPFLMTVELYLIATFQFLSLITFRTKLLVFIDFIMNRNSFSDIVNISSSARILPDCFLGQVNAFYKF